MKEGLAGVNARMASRTTRDGLFWAATISGAAVGLLCAIVALRMGLMVLDRQIALPSWAAEIWYHVGDMSDTVVFTVLYVVTPVVWVALSVWWWLSRHPTWRRTWALAVVFVVVAAGLPGAWAWSATVLWQVKRVFDIEGISRDLIYSRFTDTNYWGVAIMAGLACVLVLVLGNMVAMVRRTAA